MIMEMIMGGRKEMGVKGPSLGRCNMIMNVVLRCYYYLNIAL